MSVLASSHFLTDHKANLCSLSSSCHWCSLRHHHLGNMSGNAKFTDLPQGSSYRKKAVGLLTLDPTEVATGGTGDSCWSWWCVLCASSCPRGCCFDARIWGDHTCLGGLEEEYLWFIYVSVAPGYPKRWSELPGAASQWQDNLSFRRLGVNVWIQQGQVQVKGISYKITELSELEGAHKGDPVQLFNTWPVQGFSWRDTEFSRKNNIPPFPRRVTCRHAYMSGLP